MLLLFFSYSNSGFTQTPTANPSDSVNYAFLPALAYNSDLGLMFGGLSSRYHYRDGQKPFYSFTNLVAVGSTKGLLMGEVFFDKPAAFGSDVRLTSQVYVSRFLQDQYYGLRNYGILQDLPTDKPEYYLYQSFTTGFEFTGRKPVIQNHLFDIDLQGILSFNYLTPWENNTDHLIAMEQPRGYRGARVGMVGTGLVWEGRDSEFNPTIGTYQSLTARFSNKIFGSTYDFIHLEADSRFYTSFHLLREITFANRVNIIYTKGKVPYFNMANLGGETSLRGYPEMRFLDNNSVLLNSELRTWLFRIPSIKSKIGGNLFFDVGRTFGHDTSLADISDDLKYSYGFSGLFTLFTPDFIIRGDVGFSEEGNGVYITAGYLF